MSRKIGKILRDAFWIKQKGLAQIPLMIALLLMAIAIPAVTVLVKQQQDIRNKATDPYPCSCADNLCYPLTCTGTEGTCTGKKTDGCEPILGGNCECSYNTCVGKTCPGKNGSTCAGARSGLGCEGGVCDDCNNSASSRCNTEECTGTDGKTDCGKGTLVCNSPCNPPCTGKQVCYHAYGSNYYCAIPGSEDQCACAANTCEGNTCTGTNNAICNGTKKCEASSQCLCAANTCVGNTCSDGGGIVCQGTKTGDDCKKCTPSEPCTCSNNSVRCCNSSGTGYVTSDCGSKATCKSGTCVTNNPECKAGETGCRTVNGLSVLMFCNPVTGIWDESNYSTCNANQGCVAKDGKASCIDLYRKCGKYEGSFCTKECNPALGNLISVDGQCDGGFGCCLNTGLGTCRKNGGTCEKKDGEIVCVGGKGGTCDGAQVCGRENGGSCVPFNRCKSGASTVGLCEGGGDYLCCTDTIECLPGDDKCEGAGILKTCKDGKWESKGVCDSKKCDGNVCAQSPGPGEPGYCNPNERECVNGIIYICNSDGTNYGSTTNCPSGLCLDDGSNQCAPQQCVPGTVTCSGGVLKSCLNDGIWGPDTKCLFGCKNDRECNPSTPSPTIGGGGGGTNTPTGPVVCNCRTNPAAKAIGDANCDGNVDIYDLSIWRTEFADLGGQNTDKATWMADFNCDGYVKDNDRNDYWFPNYVKKLTPAL